MASDILVNISSVNGLLSSMHQAITWTNAVLIGNYILLEENFHVIWIEILQFSCKKMHL